MASLKNSSSRVFWGVVFIVLGFLLLLDKMGRLNFGDLISFYWPLLFILAGIWHIVSRRFRHATGGLILIVIGILFMLGKWQILGRSAWSFVWPLLIILAGLWILFGSFFRRATRKSSGEKADEIDEFALLAGVTRRLQSPAFRGGKASIVLGGMELDFNQVQLAGGEASIEVTAVLGGLDIRVPKTWRVHLEAHSILGSVESQHSFVPGEGPQQTLIV